MGSRWVVSCLDVDDYAVMYDLWFQNVVHLKFVGLNYTDERENWKTFLQGLCILQLYQKITSISSPYSARGQ